jgi:hypothetical protein
MTIQYHRAGGHLRAIASLSSKNLEQVIIVPSGSQSFVLDAELGRLLLLQDTGCEMSE